MKTNTISIEYSHIYTNENFSREHRQSIKKLKQVLIDLGDANVNKTVLIDNYNSTEHILDVTEFLKKLDKLGGGVDYYALESDMGQYRDLMLSAITGTKMLRSYERYIDGKNHIPCSFMTAIWYLIRLGDFPAKPGVIQQVSQNKFQPSDRLINILPERFEGVEARTMSLLRASKYSESAGKIETIFLSK